jgi:transposase
LISWAVSETIGTLPLKLKDWAFAIAKRSTMRKARIALARRLAIIMHAMLRDGTEFAPA